MARILVVDDNEFLRMLICEILALQGHDTVEAASTEEALVELRTGSAPDVAVIDLILPGESGWHVAHEIASTIPDCGIVLMSGMAPGPDRTAELQARTVFLQKPFDDEQLMSSIDAACSLVREEVF